MLAVAGENDVWIALIGAIALVASVAVPAWLNSRKTRHAIGKPNGQGTVVEMLERTLENQGATRESLRMIQANQEAHALDNHKRFRVVFNHLGIPYEETTE